jgi:glutamate 5-kinase
MADRHIILTDVDGLLDADGNLVPRVTEVTSDIRALCETNVSGTGGMSTKLDAAAFLLGESIPTLIGNIRHDLVDIIQDEGMRTLVQRD